RRDQLRDHQAELLEKLLENGELQSGKGLNQERRLQRLGDTRWGSHCRTLDNFVVLFSSIVHVLEVVECEGSEADDRLQAEAFLSKALQKKEQDIVNAMVFLYLTKERLQELNNRFDVVSGNLLLGMASLNPVNSFANFDKEKIITLAKYYPDEFGELKLRDLSHQLDTFILHMRHGDLRFSDSKGIGDLEKALVEANLAESYSLVYLLIKLTLILPVMTATMERAFSSMKYIKDELRSSISDTFLNGCLVCYFEKEVFTN
uniref:HAT C-terminal dimerisation domain-containing protein n=1 Tax=Nicotiana tabacum TaxID=4097 RepID=A0A1S4C3E3_TOBAC